MALILDQLGAQKGRHHKAIVFPAFFQSGVSMYSDIPAACASACDQTHPEQLRQPTLFIEVQAHDLLSHKHHRPSVLQEVICPWANDRVTLILTGN